ncbi:MAG: hypothetical protein ACJA0Q_001885 [Saprospiraceae bacterium]|jgi:hypothetical protein
MKILKSILPVALLAVIMSSCAMSIPMIVTDNANGKEGVAEYTVILGFIRPMHADASLETAAKNGGITKIATVDYVIESGLFKATYKTVVTGN